MLFRDLGNQLGQAEALNNLGQLAAQAAETRKAREHHAQALTIARTIGAPGGGARLGRTRPVSHPRRQSG